MATMADVAKAAGVSTSTVSHVINGTRYVSPDVTALVRQAITETGYVPNSMARSLKTASSNSIGLALSVMSNHYFADLVHAVEAKATGAGLTLLLTDTHDSADHEMAVVQALRGRRVDGLIIAPSPAPEKVLHHLATHRIPTVLLDRLADDRFDQVGSENTEALAPLVRHLAEQGHTRIAMISGLEGLTTTVERLEGYRLGLQRAGLGYDPALVVSGASTFEPARHAVHAVLDLDDPPTALVAGNNQMAIGVMQALRDRGLAVPDDMAVVAFDDFEWADLFAPRLTTIAQPWAEMGTTAVQLMLDRFEKPLAEPRTIRLTPTVMHRDSCRCGRPGTAL